MTLLKGHSLPRVIVAYAVRLYHRFALSTADGEDLLAERGVTVNRDVPEIPRASSAQCHGRATFPKATDRPVRRAPDHWPDKLRSYFRPIRQAMADAFDLWKTYAAEMAV